MIDNCNYNLQLFGMQKYKTIKTLGDGAFGTVYKAVNTKTGETVAIKKMKQKYTSWNQCIELREIKSLRKLNHQNIIKLKEVLLVSDQLYMVFEYLEYNLYEVYAKKKQTKKSFTQPQIKSMIYQIVSGLAHMHKNGFFHRDMKPENLLIYNNVVKLCDMGLARQIRSRPPFTDYVSTRWYRAPQLLLRSTNYNSPVDIFALGCIMAELYTQVPLFAGNNQVDQLNKIVKILGTPDKNDWPQGYKMAQAKGYYFPDEKGVNLAQIIPQASIQAIDLIQSMLKYSSRKRPTASQILKHEYFKGVKLPEIQTSNKDVIFEENPAGAKLDTVKEDKNLQIFRATKQKFKMTRKHDALDSNPFKLADKKENRQNRDDHKNHNNNANDMDDLDNLIKELEEKGKKKKQDKLPMIQTKDKFHKAEKKQLRQSKTQLKHGEPYKFIQKQDWKFMKNDDLYRKKQSSYKPPALQNNSRKGIDSKKFAYNFQPSINPVFLPIAKTPLKPGGLGGLGGGLGYIPLNQLNKPKPLIPGPAIYKY